jgi:hypothetical protein
MGTFAHSQTNKTEHYHMKKILFLSGSMPENIVRLVKSFGASTGAVKPNQDGTVTMNDLSAYLQVNPGAVMCIDAHFGPFDLQAMRELSIPGAKGVEATRAYIAANLHDSKRLPESVKLVHIIHLLSPKTIIIFVTHRKIHENVKTALGTLGVTAVIANDDTLREQTAAFTEVVNQAAQFGQTVRQGASDVFAAGKQFLHTLKTNQGSRPAATAS